MILRVVLNEIFENEIMVIIIILKSQVY